MKANYHTHTERCRHAVGTDEQYVRAAIDGGFNVLGFSDHAPWPCNEELVSGTRMTMDELPGYIQSLRDLQAKYLNQLTIHIGLESEYFPRFHDSILVMREIGVCYFVLGQHYIDYNGKMLYACAAGTTDDGAQRYAKAIVKGIQTGLFSYIAHPDLFMRYRNKDDFSGSCMEAADMICQAAKENKIPLEYNLQGLMNHSGFPHPAFWEYALKYKCDTILGLDAHNPKMLLDLCLWNTGVRGINALGYQPLSRMESLT